MHFHVVALLREGLAVALLDGLDLDSDGSALMSVSLCKHYGAQVDAHEHRIRMRALLQRSLYTSVRSSAWRSILSSSIESEMEAGGRWGGGNAICGIGSSCHDCAYLKRHADGRRAKTAACRCARSGAGNEAGEDAGRGGLELHALDGDKTVAPEMARGTSDSTARAQILVCPARNFQFEP